jgi:3-phenylpropionate/trans-cinnamate dioxygenase ferredoxin subunit
MTQLQAPREAADEYTAIGTLADFPQGQVVTLTVEGRTVGVIRTRNGIRAFGNRCPHQGGPICRGIVTGTMAPSNPDEYLYEKDGEVIRCPWHGYEFELASGRSVGGAVRGRVPVYTVQVRDDEVFLSWRRAGTDAT